MLPNETLVVILDSLCRRDLDVLCLVNRALNSLITEQNSNASRRVIALMFHEPEYVLMASQPDGFRRVPVLDLMRYIPRSIIKKMTVKWTHTLTENTCQALLECRPNFAVDAVCDFQSLSVAHPKIIRRALSEIIEACGTATFAETNSSGQHEVDNCVACYTSVFPEASDALKWLLVTHGPAADAKNLVIGETGYSTGFDFYLTNAIVEQFIHATAPKSFNVELRCFVGHRWPRIVGTTRELFNTYTNESLKIVAEECVREPCGDPALKMKVFIQRKPTP